MDDVAEGSVDERGTAASLGVAFGSENSAETGGKPGRPAPRGEADDGGVVGEEALCRLAARGVGREAEVRRGAGARRPQDSRSPTPPSPSMAAAYGAASATDWQPPICGGRSWTCV